MKADQKSKVKLFWWKHAGWDHYVPAAAYEFPEVIKAIQKYLFVEDGWNRMPIEIIDASAGWELYLGAEHRRYERECYLILEDEEYQEYLKRCEKFRREKEEREWAFRKRVAGTAWKMGKSYI